MRPSASFNSVAWRPLSSVKTFRSTLPGRYGHGLGFVTKNFGKRNGALTHNLAQLVTDLFMRLVNAVEKSLDASISTSERDCPALRQQSVGEPTDNQSDDTRSTVKPAASSRPTTSSIDAASFASHTTSIIVSFAGSWVKIRLWRMSMTLTPAS